MRVFGVLNNTKERIEDRKELVKKVMSLIHTVKQEQHGDVYYWFDADTDQFLGQGRTDDEIRVHLLERFKGHAFILDEKRALAGPDLKMVSVDDLKMKSENELSVKA
jgi:hypothetical protein